VPDDESEDKAMQKNGIVGFFGIIFFLYSSFVWADKVCSSFPWNCSLSCLADSSKWIAVGTVIDEKGGRIDLKYVIKATEVFKGNSNDGVFETAVFVRAEKISMVSETSDCKAMIRLEKVRNIFSLAKIKIRPRLCLQTPNT
jgi:hypothetical protein